MRQTLSERFLNSQRESHLFDGVVVYFQGYTEGMTSYDLKKKVIAHGGTCLAFLNGGATHVVGRNLSGSNNEAFLKRSKAKWFVTPQWIMQSVEQGRRLAEGDFLAWEDKTNNTLQRFFKPLETEDSPMECREPTIETNEDSRTLPKNQKKRDQSKTEIKHKTAFLANKLRKVPNDKLHSRLENVLDHLPKAHDSETLHH
eukprot:TRINITY_DN8064_c0_g1_i1.p2 TRINITY_DN8064_c0_g1~~TRINITY_DN8064_c0_g1_i1.p2  ORF type:complete len:200 (-),score=37.84 TRINITY_DN8064_c0_g1_i1:44-643(-)